MTDLLIDNVTDDISLTNGDLSLVSGPDELAQRVKDKLLTFVNEWFLDTSYGLDYREQILGGKVSLAVVSAVLRNAINDTIGDEGELTDLNVYLSGATRVLTVHITIDEITTEVTL